MSSQYKEANRYRKEHTSLLNKRCSGDKLEDSVSADSSELVSMVIVDNIFPPSMLEVTCFHPIMNIPLPCFVSLYPFSRCMRQTKTTLQPHINQSIRKHYHCYHETIKYNPSSPKLMTHS